MRVVAALALATLLTPAYAGDPKPEVDRLVHQLGDSRFTVREAASQKLRAMDLAALAALRKAEDDPDAEIRRRGRELIGRVGAGHGFVQVEGVEYQVVTDAVWKVPQAGDTCEPRLAVRITSRRGPTERFSLGPLSLDLIDASGRFVPKHFMTVARDIDRHESAPIAPGQSQTLPVWPVRLTNHGFGRDGRAWMTLRSYGLLGRRCERFDDVVPGKYRVALSFDTVHHVWSFLSRIEVAGRRISGDRPRV